MGRENPFQKYLGKEDVMQAEVARVLGLKFPKLFWWHTPNEGKRSAYEQFKFKEFGGKAGVSDFIILERVNFSYGLMIEIKWGKNHCTKTQVDFLIESSNLGYSAAVVYDDPKEVISLVERYLKSGVCIPEDGILLIKGGKTVTVPLADAHKVLSKVKTEKQEKQAVQKLFEKKALQKFGTMPNKAKWK